MKPHGTYCMAIKKKLEPWRTKRGKLELGVQRVGRAALRSAQPSDRSAGRGGGGLHRARPSFPTQRTTWPRSTACRSRSDFQHASHRSGIGFEFREERCKRGFVVFPATDRIVV